MGHVPAVRKRRRVAPDTSYPEYVDTYDPRHHHLHDRPSSFRSSLILLVTGMGLGYLILLVLWVQNRQVGLEEVVQRMEEHQRVSNQPFHNMNSGTAMNSPFNVTQNHPDEAKLSGQEHALNSGDSRKRIVQPIRVNHETFSQQKSSPACKPHFNLVTNHGWNNETKFKRLYFYHSRKAGGSSLRYYLEKVARHHGLEYDVVEYEKAEDPGSYDEATFYVTSIREPVSRSISGFKYEGRWECNQMIYNYSFVPTEANANRIETWIYTGGHDRMKCKFQGNNNPRLFFLGKCAFNCYIQWFTGICPNEPMPWSKKYEIAKEKLHHYNLILVLEKLRDPDYVSAVENFFAVPGLRKKMKSLCEPEAENANKKYPLVIQNDTRVKLQKLNEFDTMLYQSLTGCIENGQYDFPRWDESRFFMNASIQVPHPKFASWEKDKRDKERAMKRHILNLTLT